MDELLDRLIEDLGSTDGMTRKRAREVLALVGDPAVRRARALLASTDQRTRWEAAKTLATLADPATTDIFVSLLGDPQAELRWLAATGLINLGLRSAEPVLRTLTKGPVPRGQAEMSRRILRELSKENDVLANIVSRVMEALDGTDPALVAPSASRALSDLAHLTGRLE